MKRKTTTIHVFVTRNDYGNFTAHATLNDAVRHAKTVIKYGYQALIIIRHDIDNVATERTYFYKDSTNGLEKYTMVATYKYGKDGSHAYANMHTKVW